MRVRLRLTRVIGDKQAQGPGQEGYRGGVNKKARLGLRCMHIAEDLGEACPNAMGPSCIPEHGADCSIFLL